MRQKPYQSSKPRKTVDEVRPYVKVILETSYTTAAILAFTGQFAAAAICAVGGTGGAVCLMTTARVVDGISEMKLHRNQRSRGDRK